MVLCFLRPIILILLDNGKSENEVNNLINEVRSKGVTLDHVIDASTATLGFDDSNKIIYFFFRDEYVTYEYSSITDIKWEWISIIKNSWERKKDNVIVISIKDINTPFIKLWFGNDSDKAEICYAKIRVALGFN